MIRSVRTEIMDNLPPDAQRYLPTVVTVCADGIWTSGFQFCTSREVQIHVLTAWNPGDERPAAEVNEFRNEQLHADISVLGFVPLEALGSDPDSGHFERSWAVVGMTDDVAIELGKKYGQVAVFYITRARQWVLGCLSQWEVGLIAEDLGWSAVSANVSQLQKFGDVMSQRIKWNPLSWNVPEMEIFKTGVAKFAEKSRLVEDCHFILRGDVINESDSVEDVFIGAMIFGYGQVGYGPSRVVRVIRENRDLITKLNRQYEAAARGIADSWSSHTHRDRIKYLGPAFATKFAYFAARQQKVDGVVPLIADLNTSWAMWWLSGIPRSVQQHNSYRKYVETVHTWGSDLGCDYGADEIERSVFTLGQGMNKSIKKRDYSNSLVSAVGN